MAAICGQIRRWGPLLFWDLTLYQSVAGDRSSETDWWPHLQGLAEPMSPWKCLNNYFSLMNSLPTVSRYVLEGFLIKSCVRRKILWYARHNTYENTNQPTWQEKLQCPKRTFRRISQYQWHQHSLTWLYYLIKSKIFLIVRKVERHNIYTYKGSWV